MADITKTVLLRLNAKAEDVWKTSALTNSRVAQTEAVKAILMNQTATFANFDDWTKDRKLGISWIDPCGGVVRDCVKDNCIIVEDELSTDMVEVEPNVCKELGFSINEDKLRTNMYDLDNMYQVGMKRTLDALDEYLSTHVLAGLKASTGTNVSPDPYTWNNTAKTTEVPTASYNIDLIPDLVQDAILNKMGTPYFIDNGALWKDFFKAEMNKDNAEGKGNKAMADYLGRMYFDMFNFAKAGLSESTFMISSDAVALKTTNKFAPTIVELKGDVGQTRYRIDSPNLEGVQYDVIYKLSCVDGEIVHTWRVYLRGFFAVNPKGCPVSVNIGGTPTLVQSTGILSYTKVA